jgi:hypothetical protein
MPRRSGRWVALAVVLLIAGFVALVITGQGTLSNDSRQISERWKPLRGPLADRYELLGGAAGVVDQVSPDRSVTADIQKAQRTWNAAQKHTDIDAQVAAANELEGLARRLDANVAASAKLTADTDVKAALDAFHQSTPAQPLVDGFDDATAQYAKTRTSIGRRLAAAIFGYDARPALRLT